MEAFGYLSVMFSIVVGLGLTRVLAGIGNMVQIRRRVKTYWLHSTWVLIVIGLHLNVWWSLWALRVVTDWNYASFAYVLFGPAAIVIASHTLIPELVDARIDCERHYYDTAPAFFAMLAAGATWALFLETLMGQRPFFVPFRLLQAGALTILVALAASKNRRFHAGATGVIIVFLATAVALTRFRFGQFELG